MLVVLQIPMADLRPFRADGSRKARPHWPLPDTREFVRFFGPIRERRSSKVPLAWSDEQFYAGTSRALSFTAGALPPAWTCAFRRLLNDGGPVVRFEVGFHVPSSRTPIVVLNAVGKLMDLDCKVRKDTKSRKLAQVGQRVAELYAHASAGQRAPSPECEVAVGKPTVLVQYGRKDTLDLPKFLDFDSDHLSFASTVHSGTAINLWLTSEEFGEPRATRTALLRLSAEQQCLKLVLRDITDRQLDLSEDTPKTQALQQYLRDASRTLSKESRFGIDATTLIRLTQSYNALCGGNELQLLQEQLARIRPQIRAKVLEMANKPPASGTQPNASGPDFQWKGDFQEIEYQAFLSRPRPPILAAWLADVTSRLCPAVCLLRVPRMNRTATGFLVGKDLILTNYHVMKHEEAEDGAANLADLEMVFTASAQPARSFRLVPGQAALLAWSVKEEKDYVLLRVEESVAEALAISPFFCDGKAEPVKGQMVSMMQHPGGGALEISIDPDGVSGVYPDAGTVQYISLASGGSSGSPCIDGEKRLVALHHAERGTAFGSIREGILITSIFPEIAAFLS